MELFQRRRWICPDRVAEGLEAFVAQLDWIDTHTGLSMAGWRAEGHPGGLAAEPGAILATTTYHDHGWFLEEVARLQSLRNYGPVNEATATLTVGVDTFERWNAPMHLPSCWTLGDPTFRQDTGPDAEISHIATWSNVEGGEGHVTWFPDEDKTPAAARSGVRTERWRRIH
ncbi:MAG TPA: hypothetical protein QF651_05670 [Acidimicrobiales bacterium]|jgi:hypothetical protein|nr:hypothetical protein [Acidimicrobiales bacterium]